MRQANDFVLFLLVIGKYITGYGEECNNSIIIAVVTVISITERNNYVPLLVRQYNATALNLADDLNKTAAGPFIDNFPMDATNVSYLQTLQQI